MKVAGDSTIEESSKSVMFLELDVDSLNLPLDDPSIGSPIHYDNIDLDEEDHNKMPKWWHNAIGDVWVR